MPPVTIYSKPGCQPCRMTKMQFEKSGISYQEVDISSDEGALERIQSLGFQQAPVVTVGDDSWSGFRMDKIKELAALATA